MKNRRHIVCVAAVLMVVVSACTKQPADAVQEGVVDIRVAVGDTPGQTKGIVTGTDFPNWNGQENDPTGTFGIFSCVHEDIPSEYLAHKPAAYNARGYKAGSTLRYHYVASPTDGKLDAEYTSRFILAQRKDNKTADLYAYAPWTQDAWASGPTAIPFQTIKQWDWMYAIENDRPYLTPIDAQDRENSDLDPTGADLKAAFYFRHAMARLDFRFHLQNAPTVYDISLMSITRSDGAHLYASGTFNAITGALENLVETDSLSPAVASVRINSTGEFVIRVLLVPETFGSAEKLTFLFQANGANGQLLQPFVLTRDRVAHGDGVTYGLQAGYTYNYHFTLDNYVFFDGFSVDTDWTTPTNPDDNLNPIHI